MATTLQIPQADEQEEPSFGGGLGGFISQGGGPPAVRDSSGDSVRTGIWVALAAITMAFAALTSAMCVREGSSSDWNHIALPGILWFNTIALMGSSVTLEFARRRIGAFMRGQHRSCRPAEVWLSLTMILGLAFVVGQFVAWLKLRAEGLYLPTNPNGSFFYVFTGAHAVHVIGGLGGLVRVTLKFLNGERSLRRSTLDATTYYWHFMGLLWIFLLFLLWTKL